LQPADFTAELRHNIYPTLPCLDIQLHWQTASESKCRRNATWITSTWSLQGSSILHNANAFYVTGQDFQLYPAKEGHSESTIEYHDDVRVFHIQPITHQEVKILQGNSPPYASKLEGVAATSKLFKH